MSSAAREARRRAREAQGIGCVHVSVGLVDMAELLIANGYLPHGYDDARDDRRRVLAAALERFLADLASGASDASR